MLGAITRFIYDTNKDGGCCLCARRQNPPTQTGADVLTVIVIATDLAHFNSICHLSSVLHFVLEVQTTQQ